MILRKTILYLPAAILGPLLQVVQVLVLTYWLTPTQVGLHALVVAAQDLLHLLALVWWSQYVLRYLEPRDGAARPAQDRAEILLLLCATVVQVLLSVGIVLWIVGAGASAGLILAVALSTVGRSIVAHWSARARADQRAGLYATAQVAAPAAGLAITLLLFAMRPADLEAVFVGSAIGHVAVLCLLWPALGLVRNPLPADPAILRAAFRYGSYTLAGATLAWISLQAVRFTNDALLGPAAVGLISVGWGIGQRVSQQLAGLATTAVFPLAVERARTQGLSAGLDQLSLGGTLLLAVSLPATVGVAILAEPLAVLLTAAPFREMTAIILPLACCAGAARVMRHNYLDEVLQLAERPGIMLRLDALDAVLTVVLCILGAAWYGVVGSVVGCVIGSVVATIVALVVVRTTVDFSIDWVAAAKITLATSLMAALLLSLPPAQGLAALSLTVLAGAATFAVSLLAIGGREARRFRGQKA